MRHSNDAVKYAVDLSARLRRHAANKPATSFSPKSAPLFFKIPAGVGTEAAFAAAFSKSIAE